MKLLWLWVVGWTGFAANAAQLLDPPQLEVTATGATIHWVTDVPTRTAAQVLPASGRVEVGGERRPSTQHTVTVGGLQPGENYVIRVGTARLWLATNSFATLTGTEREVAAKATQTISPASGWTSPRSAPTARRSWADPATLADHFHRHGDDFHARDAEEYARLAWEFLRRARQEGLPAKVDAAGVLRVYDPGTRAFGAYNRDGTTKTFFKPGTRDYFERQPGRPVNLKTWK
jgi:pyocin large subunit-like protein